jgi:hypothetical protein
MPVEKQKAVPPGLFECQRWSKQDAAIAAENERLIA